MDDFLDLENMSEEEIAQLMELGILDDQGNILDKQLAQAQAVRNAPGPEGRDSGRVYTAANPLEHIVNAAQGIKAGREIEDIAKKQEELLAQQTAGRKTFLDALRKKPMQGLGPMPMRNVGVL
jgi:hypothetical protein